MDEETMFCYQCEQTAKGEGCSKLGVCGKEPDVAALQDLFVYALQGISLYAVEGRKVGVSDREVNVFAVKALFSTLTNVDFDQQRFADLIGRCVKMREDLKQKVYAAGGEVDYPDGPATFKPAGSLDDLVEQGVAVGMKSDPDIDPDILSLQHTLLFGMKGVAAYADHAQILGQEDDAVYGFIHEGLASMLRKDLSLDEWVGLVLKCDLKDLEELLKQTEGKGIYVYTHGEMLPTHGYPELKQYPHFYGHYGTAWQNQTREFESFPGAILMTTNCLQKPKESYRHNIFTCGLVGWPGIAHISDRNFAPVIDRALALPGFQEDTNGRTVMVGFARNSILGVADKVIDAVKAKAIRHFFLVAGCDGAKPGRNYYTEFVENVPEDCVVLTLACGKFRFFDKDLGDIGGIPRLLDVGQCNDAYSAIQVAVALSEAFEVEVNELPLSMILSWYEQKAVAILLTLLYLGIKEIRLGPSLPAFLSPNVLETLVKAFDIKPITTPEEDLKTILG
jgi:hydroxylamine reductase